MDVLTKSLVRLAAAFPQANVPESTVTLYHSKLAGLEQDVLGDVVERLIESSRSFPTVAEIRDLYQREHQRRQEPTAALPVSRAPMPAAVKRQIAGLLEKMDERAEEMEAKP